MRILGIGHSCELGDMCQRLSAEGHDVRVFIRDFAESGVMDGIVARVDDWRDHLDWIRVAGTEGVIVFEEASDGHVHDELRRDGFFVIGGGAFGDKLENDRAFGQAVLAQLGLRTASAHAFEDVDEAIRFVRAHPTRYVFKLDGGHAAAWRNYVGQAADGSDVIALLQGQKARLAAVGISSFRFLLMELLQR
jgi:phosphoribosylamine--glycine ligase